MTKEEFRTELNTRLILSDGVQWTAIPKHAVSNHPFTSATLTWVQIEGFLDGKKVFAPTAGL